MKNFMEIAYKEANKAYKKKEIPVGAIIVKENKIIAKSCNNRQKKHYLLGHAEINCILKAEKKLKDWRLDNCEMYVTLEPCEMCKTLIKHSRLKKVYYLLSQNENSQINPLFLQTNDCDELTFEYKRLLTSFFKEFRK